MYNVAEQSGDYGVEGAVANFEVEQENVLVLQDQDFDDMEIEEVAQVLETALNDLRLLSSHHRLVTEAIRCGGRGHSGIHHRAIAFNECLSRSYGPVKTSLAVEAFSHSTGLKLALEEEENKQKGFFTRIIDAIVKAFTWLWEKITGFFSDGEADTEKTKKKAEDAADAIDAMPSKAVEGDGLFQHAQIQSTFGFLGDPITDDLISKHLVDMTQATEKVHRLLATSDQSFSVLMAFAKRAGQNGPIEAKDVSEPIKIVAIAMNEALISLGNASLDELTKADVLEKGVTPKAGTERKLVGFAKGGGLYSWGNPVDDEHVVYTTVFKAKAEATTAKSVKVARHGSAKSFAERILDLSTKFDKDVKFAKELRKKNLAQTAELGDLLKGLMEKADGKEEETAAKEVFKVFQVCGQSISKTIIAAAYADRSIRNSFHVAGTYLTASLGEYVKGNKESAKGEAK